jgi:segregation and condensation protein A
VDVTTEGAFQEGAFFVELERFQGPLDLLLHLIREQDIDIFDIPIAQITAQFLAAIEGVASLGLDRAGEFLETAAMLIRIKAQMILPRRGDETGESIDPRAELVRRLLEYEHFREAANRLEEMEAGRRRQFRRGFVPSRNPRPVVVELTVEWDAVHAAALGLADRARRPEEHHVQTRPVPLEDKIGLIAQTLRRLARIEFSSLIQPFGNKLHAVMTLLAGLELAKRRHVELRQGAPFTPLWLYRGKEIDATDPDR